MDMTEDDWLTCADPNLLLDLLDGRASARKLRLFACACCRRVKRLLDEQALRAIEVAERYADGDLSTEALRAARLAANPDRTRPYRWEETVALAAVREATCPPSREAARRAANAAAAAARSSVSDDESYWQSRFVRDIFGNPFRPVAVDPAWRTADVAALARALYDEGDFGLDQMAVLADALEEAGCADAEVREHCHSLAGHVRGCWLLDELLDA
jgi:hypothetical protein